MVPKLHHWYRLQTQVYIPSLLNTISRSWTCSSHIHNCLEDLQELLLQRFCGRRGEERASLWFGSYTPACSSLAVFNIKQHSTHARTGWHRSSAVAKTSVLLQAQWSYRIQSAATQVKVSTKSPINYRAKPIQLNHSYQELRANLDKFQLQVFCHLEGFAHSENIAYYVFGRVAKFPQVGKDLGQSRKNKRQTISELCFEYYNEFFY